MLALRGRNITRKIITGADAAICVGFYRFGYRRTLRRVGVVGHRDDALAVDTDGIDIRNGKRRCAQRTCTDAVNAAGFVPRVRGKAVGSVRNIIGQGFPFVIDRKADITAADFVFTVGIEAVCFR